MHSSFKPVSPLMGFSEASKSRRSIISLTPLIDVVFILLVFFMLASSFLDWRSIAVTTVKPGAVAADDNPSIPLVLRVDATQTWLGEESLTMDAIIVRLQQRLAVEPETVVSIQPLGDTPLQSLIQVLDQLVAAGISNFSMIRDTAWQMPENTASNVSDDQ